MTNFLAPLAFGLLALLPVIVILYLLKLKRRPQVVPSTLLWRRSVQDMIANAPFQRLRNNLLLWLQLLILLLLIFALARPVMRIAGAGGESIIVMLDLSASMQTKEGDGRTRLQAARDLANKAIDGMSQSSGGLLGSFNAQDEMMIVGFADTPIPIAPMTTDTALLRRAIADATALDSQTNLKDLGYILKEKTMFFDKDGALVPNPRARVLLISDGKLGPTIDSLADVENIDFTAVGESDRNVGLTAIDVRESFSGQFEYQVFVSAFNASDLERSVFVELDIAGEVIDLKKIDLAAHATGGAVFTLAESIRGLATAKLVDNNDAFALDDVMRANVAPPTQLRVLIVSRGNVFFEKVFAADPRTVVSTIDPAAYKASDDYDITVFDNCTTSDLPAGNFVFVNAMPPPEIGYKTTGTVKNPEIIDWSRVHPITRIANFDRVLIGEAKIIEPPKENTPLVQAVQTDLISLAESDTRSIVVIAFDVRSSFWPVDVSFPLFFVNLVDYWSRTGRGGQKASYATGDSIALVPPHNAKKAVVTMPGGRKLDYNLDGQNTLYLTDTKEAGVYSVSFDGDPPRNIPVNLVSQLESDIAPAKELDFAGRTVAATLGDVKTSQEIWPWLVLLGLLVLVIEWMIYTRRTFM